MSGRHVVAEAGRAVSALIKWLAELGRGTVRPLPVGSLSVRGWDAADEGGQDEHGQANTAGD